MAAAHTTLMHPPPPAIAKHSATRSSSWKILGFLLAIAFLVSCLFSSQLGYFHGMAAQANAGDLLDQAGQQKRIRKVSGEHVAAQYGDRNSTSSSKAAHGYAAAFDVGRIAKRCDYSSGKWVYDPSWEPPYNESCADIFKGWNCIKNRKSHARSHLQWRWQPTECDLPKLDALAFLTRFRNKSIGFVGDSLNRNMYVSLVCTLKSVARGFKKLRQFGADRGVNFVHYNVTVAYHRTNLLAQYARWKAKTPGPLEDLGYDDGYRVDVDVPDNKWIQAPRVHDVLILNTGHWWAAPDKFDPVSSPMLFFEDGKPILPPKSPEEGLDLVLKHMLHFVDAKMQSTAGIKFLRTQSPRHFEGGDWKDGGQCHRMEPLFVGEVDRFFNGQGFNGEVRNINKHLIQAVKGTSFHLLDITPMSELRADAHPSISAGKLHEDCMHWCLPGVTDFWNDMFFALFLDLDNYSTA